KFVKGFNYLESVGLRLGHTEPRHAPYLFERTRLSATKFFQRGVVHDYKRGEALFLGYATAPLAHVLAKDRIDGLVRAGSDVCLRSGSWARTRGNVRSPNVRLSALPGRLSRRQLNGSGQPVRRTAAYVAAVASIPVG